MNIKKYLQKPVLIVAVVFVAISLVSFGVAFTAAQKNHKASQKAALESNRKKNCPGTCISLLGKTADPDIITITPNTFVQFNSADGGKHNIFLAESAVQHVDKSEYQSGDFQADEGWKVQFRKVGAYTFIDKYNPGLEIKVVVYTPGKVNKVQ